MLHRTVLVGITAILGDVADFPFSVARSFQPLRCISTLFLYCTLSGHFGPSMATYSLFCPHWCVSPLSAHTRSGWAILCPFWSPSAPFSSFPANVGPILPSAALFWPFQPFPTRLGPVRAVLTHGGPFGIFPSHSWPFSGYLSPCRGTCSFELFLATSPLWRHFLPF